MQTLLDMGSNENSTIVFPILIELTRPLLAEPVPLNLTDKGTDPSKTQSTSRGAMDATGTDEAGWAHDRRVDIMLGS
jgi:hypothetical protein